ncbi:UbiD family decarboxylase [Castellaniella sp.]|uniref:UbiD family decarboxylase n=1 Tax=Castellaniella sp. TaxID=1955812 RepID=UPI0035649A81
MRNYMNILRSRGDLIEIDRPVDPTHELAAVTKAIQDKIGKAILFKNVKGSRLPVLTHIYGTRARLAELIGIDPAHFCKEWSNLATLGAGGTAYQPRRAQQGIPEQVDLKLSDLPLITYSELDAGPYFTSAMFIAKDPDTGVGNLSFHRSMYVSDQELRCRLAPKHHLTLYHEIAEKRGEPLEAAMLIGPPSTLFLSAAAPLPYDVDELDVAAQLARRDIPMRPCKYIDLDVPADTEIVIEGRFLPNVRRPEGPFGEFMGYYTPEGPNAVFEVLGVTARPDAIFHSILCGSPEEVLALDLSISANIYQRLNAALPGILDVACQPFVSHAVIQIDPKYEGHARQVMLAVIGAEPTWAKVVTVVNRDVDIHDMNDVMWAILTRSRPDKDSLIIPDTPSFYRDEQRDHWGRLLIDATIPFGREKEFERKRLKGLEHIKLEDWIGR